MSVTTVRRSARLVSRVPSTLQTGGSTDGSVTASAGSGSVERDGEAESGGAGSACSTKSSVLVYAPSGRKLAKRTRKIVNRMFAKDCFPDVYDGRPQNAETFTRDGYEIFYLKPRCPPTHAGTCDSSPKVALMISKEPWGHTLWNVCTAISSRRQGCAEQLIRRAVRAWTKRWSETQPTAPPRFMYLLVEKNNSGAKTLYDKLGFKVVPGKSPHKTEHLMRATVQSLAAVKKTPIKAPAPPPPPPPPQPVAATTTKKKAPVPATAAAPVPSSTTTKKKKKTTKRQAPVRYKLLDFMATWCGPCKTLGPVLEKVAKARGLVLEQIDIDEDPDRASRFGVESVPSVHIVKADDPTETSLASFEGALKEREVVDFVKPFVS